MDLNRLRYFLEVAEAGSLSRASTRIGIAQPSLSRQISNLEEELGVLLFYRHGRGVALTDAGVRMRETALAVFGMLEQTRNEFQDQQGKPAGVVRWGLPPSIGATIAYPVARDFMQAVPSAKLRVREAFSAILSEWIEQETLDVAVLYDAARSKTLNAAPLLLEDLYLVQSRSVEDDSDIEIDEIRDQPLVVPGPENGLRRVIERALVAANIQPNIVMEVDSIPALRQLAGGGVGTTILPFGAIHREIRNNRLNARRIVGANMRALLVMVTPANRPVTSAAKELMRIIEKSTSDFVASDVLRGVVGNKIRQSEDA